MLCIRLAAMLTHVKLILTLLSDRLQGFFRLLLRLTPPLLPPCFCSSHRYWAVTSPWRRNFRSNWRQVVAYQNCAHPFAQSFYLSLASECKAASKSTTCPRNGCQFPVRFEQNSTATSDSCAQSLEMMSGMILNQKQSKFAAKSFANEML